MDADTVYRRSISHLLAVEDPVAAARWPRPGREDWSVGSLFPISPQPEDTFAMIRGNAADTMALLDKAGGDPLGVDLTGLTDVERDELRVEARVQSRFRTLREDTQRWFLGVASGASAIIGVGVVDIISGDSSRGIGEALLGSVVGGAIGAAWLRRRGHWAAEKAAQLRVERALEHVTYILMNHQSSTHRRAVQARE